VRERTRDRVGGVGVLEFAYHVTAFVPAVYVECPDEFPAGADLH
jgi:hypothetical protein